MAKKNQMVPKGKQIAPQEYTQILSDIRQRIREAQLQAATAANRELLKLYWYIGRSLSIQQEVNGWGDATIEKLADDIQKSFPGIAGFSRRNIYRMRAFFESYAKVQQAALQIFDLPIFSIPWGHNAVILEKLKKPEERLWYAQKTIDNGLTRNALESAIRSKLHTREGKAVTNFVKTLLAPHSDLAQQSLKDPYIFDFLALRDGHVERELEHGLVSNVQKCLLELGKGFAFIGQQQHIVVSGKDYYMDLLFYHYKLRCFVVVELKAREFEPQDTGQINFYIAAIDKQMRASTDNPTIGILLCKTKDNLTVEYALYNVSSPIGVAGYETAELSEKLPKNLKSSLPTIEEIEEELEKQKPENQ